MSKAREKVDLILQEGCTVLCDGTQDQFKCSSRGLPDFYDEDKYKRGQEFFQKHVFSMLFGKLLGLLAVLAVPTILKILVLTKMSSTYLSAYRRYVATIFHMCIWYEKDFLPGSALWESIDQVKTKHNAASRRGCKAGLHGISQKDMALTQFGFMGFIVARPQMLGVHEATDEEIEAFIHLWRVVGHLMGIENRFNICSGSVQETKQICEQLIEIAFVPCVKTKSAAFLEMADYMITGLWVINPFLEVHVFLDRLYLLLNANLSENDKIERERLNFWRRSLSNIIDFYVNNLKYKLIRLKCNLLQNQAFWLMKNFPFLAYFQYGYKSSNVSITGRQSKLA